MTAHTPGPWHAATFGARNAIIYDDNGWSVADAKVFHGKREWHEMDANARLIAAAPDLLAALEFIVDKCAPSAIAMSAWEQQARSAVAKAKGQ